MSREERLEAEIEGYKAAIQHIRLGAKEWERREARAIYELAQERLRRLDLEIDLQREALGLPPEQSMKQHRERRTNKS